MLKNHSVSNSLAIYIISNNAPLKTTPIVHKLLNFLIFIFIFLVQNSVDFFDVSVYSFRLWLLFLFFGFGWRSRFGQLLNFFKQFLALAFGIRIIKFSFCKAFKYRIQ